MVQRAPAELTNLSVVYQRDGFEKKKFPRRDPIIAIAAAADRWCAKLSLEVQQPTIPTMAQKWASQAGGCNYEAVGPLLPFALLL